MQWSEGLRPLQFCNFQIKLLVSGTKHRNPKLGIKKATKLKIGFSLYLMKLHLIYFRYGTHVECSAWSYLLLAVGWLLLGIVGSFRCGLMLPKILIMKRWSHPYSFSKFVSSCAACFNAQLFVKPWVTVCNSIALDHLFSKTLLSQWEPPCPALPVFISQWCFQVWLGFLSYSMQFSPCKSLWTLFYFPNIQANILLH